MSDSAAYREQQLWRSITPGRPSTAANGFDGLVMYNSIDGVVPNLDDITRKLIIPPMTTTIDTLDLCPPCLASAHVNLINGSAVAKG